jgi:hypothetical protein
VFICVTTFYSTIHHKPARPHALTRTGNLASYGARRIWRAERNLSFSNEAASTRSWPCLRRILVSDHHLSIEAHALYGTSVGAGVGGMWWSVVDSQKYDDAQHFTHC